MKPQRPVCPDWACINHENPPAGFYRKRGYRVAKHNHQPIPRYQCKACLKYFCATQTKPIRGQHRPELNHQIFKLAVSGVTMNRMVKLLGCSERTVALKISHLAHQARLHHQEHMKTMKTSYVMVDELETFMHSRYKQLSVVMAVRVKTGEVLGFGVARKPSNQERGWKKYNWVHDDRPLEFHRVLKGLNPHFHSGVTIATDLHPSYPKWLNKALQVPYTHKQVKSPNTPGYDPLFAINVSFAKMRNDLARLGRKTWTTTKTIKGLTDHLWLWVAWTNGYEVG